MKYAKRLNLVFAALSALTLIAAVIQTVLYLRFYDPVKTLYLPGAPSYLILAALAVLLIGASIGALTAGKGKLPKGMGESAEESGQTGAVLVRVGGLLLLLGAVLSGILLLYGDFPGDHARTLWQAASASDGSVNLAGNLLRLATYAGILAAVWPSLLLILGRHRPGSAALTLIWLLLLDLSIYFDNSAVMNDPIRLSEILGLSAAVIWLCGEIRRGLAGQGRRSALLRGMIAGPILCVCSLPRLIATAAGTLPFTSRTLIPVSLLGLAILIGGRLCQIRRLPDVLPDSDEKESEKAAQSGDPLSPDGADGAAGTVAAGVAEIPEISDGSGDPEFGEPAEPDEPSEPAVSKSGEPADSVDSADPADSADSAAPDEPSDSDSGESSEGRV